MIRCINLNKKRIIGNVRGRGWLSQYMIKWTRRASLRNDFEPRLQVGEKVIDIGICRENLPNRGRTSKKILIIVKEIAGLEQHGEVRTVGDQARDTGLS